MGIQRSGIKLLVSKIGSSLVGFIGLSYFSKLSGGSILGPFFLIQAGLAITAIPADLGIRSAVEKRISEGQDPGVVLSSGILLKVILLCATGLVVFFFRSYINSYLGGSFWHIFFLGLVLQEVALLFIGVLRGELRVGDTALMSFIRNTSWVIFGYLLYTLGIEYNAPIIGLLIGFVLISIIGLLKISTSFSSPSWAQMQSLVDFGKYDALSKVSWQVFSWLDILVIGYFLSSVHVAAYEVSWRITAVTTLLATVISTTIFPHVSSLSSAEREQRIEDIVKKSLIPSFLIVIPSLFGILVIGPEILTIAFSDQFIFAKNALVILMILRIAQSAHSIFSRSLSALNHPELVTKSSVITAVINVCLNIVLVPLYGLAGAASATAVSYSINSIIQYKYLSQYISVHIPIKIAAWSLIASGIMFLSISYVHTLITIDSLVKLVLIICVGVLSYFLSILFSSRVRSEIRFVVKSVKN
ncbi:flippase [Haloferax prahovense]|uniref:flippase n=1 Tax=Haloferax prahovense TaxID=381852 RepID=UPI0009DCAE02|nr:flippase [Haloferax prahovense]